jgi:3-oxoacyl-[acyl-carrier-protein] synthase-3
MSAVGIRAVGRYVPDGVVTNADLVARYDTTEEWIRERLAIETRRVAGPDQWTSDLAVAALRDACERAAIAPATIDLLICATGTPDHMLPATAAAILRKAELRDIAGFDVNAGGCAGGVFALDVGAKYVASGQYRRVAVVVADTVAQALDPADRTTPLIFGDGAACYLLEPCAAGSGVGPVLLRTFPDLYYAAYVERLPPSDARATNRFSGANLIRMNGREILRFTMGVIPDFAAEVVKKADTTLDDVDLIITHQANPSVLPRLMEALGQPRAKTVVVADRLGNTSGSSIMLAMVEAVDTGRLRAGDSVLLIGFGSGMNLGGTVVRWCGPHDFAAAGAAR